MGFQPPTQPFTFVPIPTDVEPNLQFVDEVSCPIPAGTQVTIFEVQPSGVLGNIVIQSFTTSGGWLAVEWPQDVASAYVAYFVGNQAPPVPQVFYPPLQNSQTAHYDEGYKFDGNAYYDFSPGTFPTLVTVYNYRSPCKTALEYANEGCYLQPLGWYSQDALTTQNLPGFSGGGGSSPRTISGVLHSVMRGMLAGHAIEDAASDKIHEALRLQSCSGSEIDTWSNDMVGSVFQRYSVPEQNAPNPNAMVVESDALFVERLLLMISRPRCTINFLQAMVQAFFNSIADEPVSQALGQMAFGVAGGYNAFGAFNTFVSPTPGAVTSPIIVWDGMTQPQWASFFNILPTQFVIQIGVVTLNAASTLSFNVGGGFNTQGAFNISPTQSPSGFVVPTPTPTAPDYRLALLVNLISKGAGLEPLYLVGQQGPGGISIST